MRLVLQSIELVPAEIELPECHERLEGAGRHVAQVVAAQVQFDQLEKTLEGVGGDVPHAVVAQGQLGDHREFAERSSKEIEIVKIAER